MSITRSMLKKSGAQSVNSGSKPHITFYRKDMSTLKSTRILKRGRPFNRKYHNFTKLYFTPPKTFRSHAVVTENDEIYYVRRDLLKLGVDNSVKQIEREIQVVKDNPIIRLKPAVRQHQGRGSPLMTMTAGARRRQHFFLVMPAGEHQP